MAHACQCGNRLLIGEGGSHGARHELAGLPGKQAAQLTLERASATTASAALIVSLADPHSYETGWPDARTAQEQRLKGERLAAAIVRELSLGDSIVFAHWETTVAGREPREA